jgi:hypothetical protein
MRLQLVCVCDGNVLSLALRSIAHPLHPAPIRSFPTRTIPGIPPKQPDGPAGERRHVNRKKDEEKTNESGARSGTDICRGGGMRSVFCERAGLPVAESRQWDPTLYNLKQWVTSILKKWIGAANCARSWKVALLDMWLLAPPQFARSSDSDISRQL